MLTPPTKAPLVLILIAFLACSSCIVIALKPWFGEEFQVFERSLLGSWIDAEDGSEFVFERGFNGRYRIESPEDDELCMDAALGKISGVYYLDLRTCASVVDIEAEWDLFQYVKHQLYRLEIEADMLTLTGLDADKFNEFLRDLENEASPVLRTTEHAEEGTVVLEGTEEMENFLLTHGREADIWSDDPTRLTRQW
jgi:hypothetical protein